VWTTLATGMNPGHHGVFDFLKPDPERMSIDLAITKYRPRARGLPTFERAREAKAFWDITTARGIHTSVIRWPVTFPAEEVSGHFLSGLGTPDIHGRLGSYSFFTTRPVSPDDKAPERVERLRTDGESWAGELVGPTVARLTGARPSKVPFRLERRAEDEVALCLSGQQPVILRVGEWSPWLHVRFSVGWFRKVSAVFKCLLVTADEGECSLYVGPPQVDPEAPCFDVSWPRDYAAEMARELGTFHTLGMPEDTKGVTDGRFELESFLVTCDEVIEERKWMLERELDLLPPEGVLAVVFDTLDRIQHLFWASEDPTHPIASDEWQAKWRGVIEKYYQLMDRIVGTVLERAGPEAVVLTLSDHGFTSFRRAVHLNRWLAEQGYMSAQLGAQDQASSLFGTVDWSRTRAYACGFGAIYLNLRGREAKGIVSPGEEADELRREIAQRMANEFQDAEMDARVVREAFVRDDVFSGPLIERAPDVLVGFEPGYRASWQTALGGGLQTLVEDHADPWCGDHLVHPECVPGVLFCNRPLAGDSPRAADIAPTVLSHFGLDVPGSAEGGSVLGSGE